jgi:NAD(P)-dependent dehydrogenase (short-subunit alcohol dehydrogenase family)
MAVILRPMKTYLVTGASRGIGAAAAKMLLEAENTVYGTFNSNQAAADTLAAAHENFHPVQADFTKQDSVAGVAKSLGSVRLDGIVNSAGIFLDTDFANFDATGFEATFRVNAFTPFYLVQALQSNLRDEGSIVNISATDAMTGSISGIAYGASKAALINLTQSLTNVLAPRKIRSNALALGWVGDGMQSPEGLLKLAADYTPLKRNATYKEVAQVILFLLSDQSSYINGAVIPVDGGDMATNYILQKEAEF